jgi:hypothetical protein
MMRKIALVAVGLMLAGCSSLHHVPPDTFECYTRNMNSLYWCEYIGQADGKAFLLRKRAPLFWGEMKQDILFTEAARLNRSFLDRLNENRMRGASNQASQAIGAPGAPQPER